MEQPVAGARFEATRFPWLPGACLAMGALCGMSGCDKKADQGGAAPSAAGLTASTADGGATAWRFVVDPGSAAHVDMPGLTEHIKADTSAAAGSLDLVPFDLAQSRGLVRVDLSTLTTHTFGDDDKDATQTKHARTWLEAVVDGKTNEAMRWAEFAIRSVDGLSASDVRAVSPTRDGGDDVRAVSMTVHGDLLVHGRGLPKDDAVDVLFRYPAGAPAASVPRRIEIKSREPMRVVLKEHDVAPRDPAGQILAWTANLISKVANTADITVALSASPAPR
ncbi:MAG: hypothetical protein JOZ69_18595 [Myxococcales bacterium]|nr:hypothetical protein [Myxococcales bacterium]